MSLKLSLRCRQVRSSVGRASDRTMLQSVVREKRGDAFFLLTN